MKIKRPIYFVSISLVVLTTCGVFNSSKKEQNVMKQNQSITIEPVVRQGFAPDAKEQNYTIEKAFLTDTTLTIELGYWGGCNEHSFDLIFNGMYKKSLPRQADLFLVHENHGDTCKDKRNITLRYNLSSIIGTSKQATNFTLIGYPDKIRYGSVPKN